MRGLARSFRDFALARKASTTLVFALTAPMLIGIAAFATDMGEIYLHRRALQAAVDAAAVGAASHPDIAATVARKILNAAGETEAGLVVQFGAWEQTASDRDGRFVVGRAGNAVRVEAKLKRPARFGRIFTSADFEIEVRADAALAPVVSISVGSRLVTMDSGLLGGLLSGPLGSAFDLATADENALARSKIELGALLRAVGPAGATVRQTVDTPIRVTDFLSLMATEMGRRADLSAMAVLRKAALRTARSDTDIRLSQILRLDGTLLDTRTDYPTLATRADLSVADLFGAAMKQLGIDNSLETSLAVPGIGGVDVALRIGEAGLGTRAVAVSEKMPSVEADVIRLRTRASTVGLLDLLSTRLTVPIEIVAGGGTAQVTNVRCAPDPADRRVTVSVRPGLIKLALGTWSLPLADAGIHQKLPPAEILSILGAGIEAQSFLQIGSLDPVDVTFTASEIANATVKTVRSRTLLQSLVGTLFAQTTYTVRGAPLPGLVQKVGVALAPLAAPLDKLLDGLLAFAGLGLGEIDLRIDGLVCERARIIG